MRFIINLPKEELQSVERICFQVEEAQWFYEDFIRPLDPDLPSLNLRNFCLLIFQHCPMFSSYSTHLHAQAFSEFLAYKTRVPVRGAIMLNEKMDSVVLVKGWKKGANWSFPRGKINKDEPDLDCAVREVYEETGYDIKAAGLVGSEEETKHIEVTMREQHMRLYVFRGVPMDTYFEPRTRKEISKIEWYKLSDLPTIRKKKQQQEGKGEDLAVNANRFYMVAPFLVPLKKWISAQRKLDKAKQSNGIVANATAVEEEPAHIANHDAEEGTRLHPSNEDLGRLLDSLRQSALPAKTNDRPEVSRLSVEPRDITAELKTLLGVSSTQPANSVTEAAPRPISTNRTENQKSIALLALLRGSPAGQVKQSPQTPVEQVKGDPPPPASPPHPHHQPPPFSSLPPPPSFPFPTDHDQPDMAFSPGIGLPATMPQAATDQPSQPPQVKSISLLHQPAQLVPRSLHRDKPVPRATTKQQTLAPYQRTGDPQFAQYSQIFGDNALSIPPASKLPPPKLTAQSSALLNLFKSGQPAKTPRANSDSKVSGKTETEIVPANPSANAAAMLDMFRDDGKTASAASQKKPETIHEPTSSFKPLQALPKKPSVNANEIDRPKSEHQDKLLSLFRRPSVPAAEPVKPAANFLQPPSGPVELSAQPMTPGHSREPSVADTLPQEQAPKIAGSGSSKTHKGLPQTTSKAHHHPVSATVNGPLNVPQFDMLAKASKEARHAAHGNNHKKSPRMSPLAILARPSSSHAHPQAPPSLTGAHVTTPPPSQPKATIAPKLQTFLSPVNDMPPTPDLKGYAAPFKPFHPQILRRPAHSGDAGEPSPIQPLPSPEHDLLANRTTQPADHKKSLLSRFTKSSLIVSPALTAPASASAIDPASLVSPLSEKPTPREQADAAFAKSTRDIGGFAQEHTARPVSPSRASSIDAFVAGMEGKKRATGGTKTPTTRTTPIDRNFLLGYLEGVAKGGR